MIVQINQTNIDSYTDLFKRAYDSLLNSRIEKLEAPSKEDIAAAKAAFAEEVGSTSTLTSIDQYFNYIKDLYLIDKRYLMLPLDEKALDVDANSRKINVPTEYQTNGIGVEGDILAETLTFKIDRYFDYMDLSTARAYVQWELPDGSVGASDITIRDLETEPGKIIFCWPLTESITKASGSIKFSVRFFKRDDNDESRLVYSFNTIPQTVSLNKALQFDVQEDGDPSVDNASFLFAQAIINSPVEDNSCVASRPVYEVGGGLNLSGEAFLKEDALILKAQAISADTGEISYQWERKLATESEFSPVEGAVAYEPVVVKEGEAFDPNKNKRYYLNNGDSYGLAEKKDVDAFVADPTSAKPLYERFSIYSISSGPEPVTGIYRVKAYNTVNKSVSLPANSNECKLSGPTNLSLKAIEEPLIRTKEKPELTLSPVVTVDHPDLTETSYEWSSGLTPDSLSPVVEGGDQKDLTVKADGFYNLKVAAKLNRETINSTYDVPYRVTSEPQKLTLNPEAGAEDIPVSRLEPEQTTELTVYIENSEEELNNRLFSDGYEFAWGRLNGDEKVNDSGVRTIEPVVAGSEDCVSITNGVESAGTHRHYSKIVVRRKPNLGVGQIYVCQVTNILNGLTAKAESGQFLVVTKG